MSHFVAEFFRMLRELTGGLLTFPKVWSLQRKLLAMQHGTL
jgi:hypothetical protein